MGEVRSITEKQPHKAGPAHCIHCKHAWAAVALPGTVWLDCPECGSEKGVFTGPCQSSATQLFECNCGNDLFRVHPEGIFCPNCGVWVNPY